MSSSQNPSTAHPESSLASQIQIKLSVSCNRLRSAFETAFHIHLEPEEAVKSLQVVNSQLDSFLSVINAATETAPHHQSHRLLQGPAEALLCPANSDYWRDFVVYYESRLAEGDLKPKPYRDDMFPTCKTELSLPHNLGVSIWQEWPLVALRNATFQEYCFDATTDKEAYENLSKSFSCLSQSVSRQGRKQLAWSVGDEWKLRRNQVSIIFKSRTAEEKQTLCDTGTFSSCLLWAYPNEIGRDSTWGFDAMTVVRFHNGLPSEKGPNMESEFLGALEAKVESEDDLKALTGIAWISPYVVSGARPNDELDSEEPSETNRTARLYRFPVLGGALKGNANSGSGF